MQYNSLTMVVYDVLEKEVAPADWHKEACIMGIGACPNFEIPRSIRHDNSAVFVSPASPRPVLTNNDGNIADEAGRGPVLGPMVYGVACCPLSMESDLKKRAFADSKVLTTQQRDDLFKELEEDERMCCFVDEISAAKISQNMLAPDKVSLNALAVDSTIQLIQKALDSGIELTHIYVDTLGKPDAHKDRLSRAFPGMRSLDRLRLHPRPFADSLFLSLSHSLTLSLSHSLTLSIGIAFIVCPKADAIYPIVSAASIAAKVSRGMCCDLSPGQGQALPLTRAARSLIRQIG